MGPSSVSISCTCTRMHSPARILTLHHRLKVRGLDMVGNIATCPQRQGRRWLLTWIVYGPLASQGYVCEPFGIPWKQRALEKFNEEGNAINTFMRPQEYTQCVLVRNKVSKQIINITTITIESVFIGDIWHLNTHREWDQKIDANLLAGTSCLATSANSRKLPLQAGK